MRVKNTRRELIEQPIKEEEVSVRERIPFRAATKKDNQMKKMSGGDHDRHEYNQQV